MNVSHLRIYLGKNQLSVVSLNKTGKIGVRRVVSHGMV